MPETIPVPELEGVVELEDGSAVIEGLEADTPDGESSFYENLAETLDDFKLNSLASDLLDLIEKDQKAREERDKQQEEGIRRTGLGNDAPGGATFDGASKVVHPLLAEGCVDFSARAIKELFPSNGPVKTKTMGEADEKMLKKARRKRDFLNFYLVERMPEYRAEKEALLTQLPLGGSQYEKYWFDGKRVRMEFVPIDKVLLPFSANSFYTSPRITHLRDLSEDKIEAHVRDGFYKDVFGVSDAEPEETSSQTANNKIEGKESSGYNEDGMRRIFEVACDWSLEGDTPAPYIVHIDEATSKVVAIYRNWRDGDEDKTRLDWWVEDKFIAWRGAYGIGLFHLIGGLAGTLTGALRALLDSAHINNAPTAIKLKGGRASGQSVTLDMTAVTEIEAPANVDDIRKIMMAVPFNPPSAVLFQLLDWITNQAKGVVATAEERIADAGANMPVGTALALIEQGSQVFSSIHARLHDSQRRALKIICRLIADYPEHALADLGRFDLVPEDFLESDDVQPVSDPNIFSESQRFAQMQAVMQMAAGDAQNPNIQWNQVAMRRRMLELLRVDGIDELLPKQEDPVTADPVQENVAAMQGKILKAVIEQDHQAHVQAHLLFVMQPMAAQGTLPPQQLAAILQHINDHLILAYQHVTMSAMVILQAQNPDMSPDQLATQAALKAADATAEWQAQVAQQLTEAQQLVQSKMPPPPVDPAVQKTFEAAMAEIKRKTDVDQAEIARKNLETQAKAQAEAMQPMIDQAKREFEARLEVERMQREDDRAKFNQMIELQKNEADNRQHQMTELMKNRDDNETQLQLKLLELQKQVSDIPALIPQAPDFTPMMQEMQSMLSQIKEAKTDDALLATVEGLRAMMATISAPTELIRDANGKAVGTRKVL